MKPLPSTPASIPLFDLPISSASSELAQLLTDAAHTYGFLYIRTPLFSSQYVSRIFSLSSSFFSLSSTIKSRYPMQSNNRGFTALHGEGLDPKSQADGDPKEAFNFGEFSQEGKADQPLPDVFTAAEKELAEFQGCCRTVCLQVLELIAEGLDIDSESSEGKSWFASRHDPIRGPSGTILRLLHYPSSSPRVQSSSQIRAGAHSDYGSLTLLFRQAGDSGLEIHPPRSSQNDASVVDGWLPVPVFPPGTESDPCPPVLVNIGDLLSYWTSTWLRSTLHRVVFPEGELAKERYSIAYFCHPIRDTRLVPVPSAIVREHILRQKPQVQDGVAEPGPDSREVKVLTATEHLQARLQATYGSKYGADTA